MREIKFRGKQLGSGNWVYGYVYCGDKFGCSTDINNAVEVSILNNDYDEYEIVKETLGQFTGLKDINGKEIYEGDIVNYFASGTSTIEYIAGGFRVVNRKYGHDFMGDTKGSIEVIGNINDNKELLDWSEDE